jgi:hypothetical protein
VPPPAIVTGPVRAGRTCSSSRLDARNHGGGRRQRTCDTALRAASPVGDARRTLAWPSDAWSWGASFLQATRLTPTRWVTSLVDLERPRLFGPDGRPHQSRRRRLAACPTAGLAGPGRHGRAGSLAQIRQRPEAPLGHATVVVDHFHAIRLANALQPGDQWADRIEQGQAVGHDRPLHRRQGQLSQEDPPGGTHSGSSTRTPRSARIAWTRHLSAVATRTSAARWRSRARWSGTA